MESKQKFDKPTISVSSINTFLTCKRRFYYEKVRNLRPAEESDALTFGAAIHEGLAQIFNVLEDARTDGGDPKRESPAQLSLPFGGDGWKETARESAMAAVRSAYKLSESDRIKCEVLLDRYIDIYWERDLEGIEVIGVETLSRSPIVIPGTQCEHPFDLLGYCDAKARDREGNLILVEHKTTGAMNDDYFEHASIDLQVYAYAMLFGKDERVHDVIYDVIQKPRHEMSVGETDEDFEARKANAKCPERCRRKEAETTEDFRKRLADAVDEGYFRRETLHIDPLFLGEARREICETANEMYRFRCVYSDGKEEWLRDAIDWPKSTCNCMKWGRCPFMDLCRNHGTTVGIEDKYTKREVRENADESTD